MCNRFPGVYCRGSRNFSSCSAEDFEKLTLNKGGSCLLNVPKPDEAYSAPSCGNKLVDPGEECDCGTPQVSWPSAWLCEVTLGFGTSGGGVAVGFCGEVRIAMVLCGCVSGTGQYLGIYLMKPWLPASTVIPFLLNVTDLSSIFIVAIGLLLVLHIWLVL